MGFVGRPDRTSVAVGAVALAHVVAVIARPGGPVATQFLDNALTLASAALAGVFGLRAARRLYGQSRRAWTFLGLASLSWAIGQGIWTFYEQVLGVETPYPSWADAGYVGFIPLAIVGVFLLRRTGTTNLQAVRDLLDGVIASAALLYIIWPKVLAPVYRDTSAGALATGLSLAYPVGDIVILTAALLLAQRMDPATRKPITLLCLGLVGITLADLSYAALIIEETYYTGHVIDLGWTIGFVLLALAAHQVQPAAVPQLTTSLRYAFSALLPYVPVVFMLVATLAFDLDTRAQDPVMETSVFLVLVAVLVRQGVSVFENRLLSQRLGISLAEIQASDGQRKQLLNNIAHDLNGPLTPIRIQAHLLQTHEPPLPADVQKGAVAMQRSVQQLERLVSDLADLAKMDVGRLRLDRRPLDLADLVSNLGVNFNPVAASQHVRLHVEVTGPLPVLGDATRLNQVITNLLGNALKFTPPAGQIILAAYSTGTHCNVSVRDTGPGLTSAQMARLFKPFVQVHDRTQTAGGSGLGLFISRGIIEAHDGHLWVESPGPGAGTTFSFALARDAGRK